MGGYIGLIVIFTILNEGLSAFLLMLCMVLWLSLYYHVVDNTERFKVNFI